MKTLVLLTLVLVAAFGQAIADTGTGVELPRDAPIPILMEISKGAEELGLTEDYVRSKVELQLRRNGLKPTNQPRSQVGWHSIYVNINVTGPAFSWEISFWRPVYYEVNGKQYSQIAKTYVQSGDGTHGRNREFILSTVLSGGIDVLSNNILKSWK
jgi:hypothetical protein